MQTTYIGRAAEQAAAEYLERQGYVVVDRNWRRRECEIDIVASRNGALRFVEVKFRMNDETGSGIDYIGHKKLRQMAYAASRWVAEHRWNGEYMLAAIEVSGATYEVTAFIDCIES